MSKYTTGELAKLTGTTVRTVQYYDNCGLLVPSELSEGGRRLYSDQDLKKMKMICFLRELGLSISTISELLKENNSKEVMMLMIEQQEKALNDELNSVKTKLDLLVSLRKELQDQNGLSVDHLEDVAIIMKDKNKLSKVRRTLTIVAVPMVLFELYIIYKLFTDFNWLYIGLYLLAAIPFGIIISRYYYRNVDYICPECHEVFKPSFKEAFWAAHTPKTRKLICPKCGHKGYCVEVYGGKDE